MEDESVIDVIVRFDARTNTTNIAIIGGNPSVFETRKILDTARAMLMRQEKEYVEKQIEATKSYASELENEIEKIELEQ